MLSLCFPAVGAVDVSFTREREEIETTSAQSSTAPDQIETDQTDQTDQTEDGTQSGESSQTEATQQKKRRKGKGQDVPEDTLVDNEYAQQLDVSCVGKSPVAAPSIDEAIVLKYAR